MIHFYHLQPTLSADLPFDQCPFPPSPLHHPIPAAKHNSADPAKGGVGAEQMQSRSSHSTSEQVR